MKHVTLLVFFCRNSSALPNVSELGGTGKPEKDRKNSLYLPNERQYMENNKGSLIRAGSNVIGGDDNYKRF